MNGFDGELGKPVEMNKREADLYNLIIREAQKRQYTLEEIDKIFVWVQDAFYKDGIIKDYPYEPIKKG